MKHLSRTLAQAASALVLLAGAAGGARADDSEVCQRAQQVVGDAAKTMLPEECQDALDDAEEERWQLWLDMGLAQELAAELVNAAQYYRRFLDGVALRTRPLSPAWDKARASAQAALDRIDEQLLQSNGRIDVRSTPPDASASFDGQAGTAGFTTPFSHYLPAGAHTVQLHSPTLGKTIERPFTLAVGQKLTLDVDLTEDIPPAPPKDKPVTTQATPEATVAPPIAVRREGPPLLESVGWLGVAAGVAGIGLGTVLYLQGSGLVDDAACSGDFCERTADYRAKRRGDGEDLETAGVVAWAAGAVLLGGGIVAILLADDGGGAASETSADVQLESVSAVPLPGGASVGASLRF